MRHHLQRRPERPHTSIRRLSPGQCRHMASCRSPPFRDAHARPGRPREPRAASTLSECSDARPRGASSRRASDFSPSRCRPASACRGHRDRRVTRLATVAPLSAPRAHRAALRDLHVLRLVFRGANCAPCVSKRARIRRQFASTLSASSNRQGVSRDSSMAGLNEGLRSAGGIVSESGSRRLGPGGGCSPRRAPRPSAAVRLRPPCLRRVSTTCGRSSRAAHRARRPCSTSCRACGYSRSARPVGIASGIGSIGARGTLPSTT